MGLLDRLRAWLRSAVDSGGGVEGGRDGAATYDYECTVCGTGVDAPDADCPLCRSSDLVAADTDASPATTADAGTAGSPGGPSGAGGTRPGDFGVGGGGPREARRGGTVSTADPGSAGPARRHVAAADDEAVERLRDLRGDDELLERHADRWEPHPGGFRVETATGTRIVDSREEVVALLRATDR